MTGASRLARLGCALLLTALLGAGSVAAAPLEIGISTREVLVTTNFAGAELVLFGAVEDEGDLAVVVRGPAEDVTVRLKERIAGLWVNSASMRFPSVPGFYTYGTTLPLLPLGPPQLLDRHGIGIDHLQIHPDEVTAAEAAKRFRDALVRSRRAAGLFPQGGAPIQRLGRHLFRFDLIIPANAPVGRYRIEVLVLRKGQVIARVEDAVTLVKFGFSAGIADFAAQHPAAYGLIALALAIGAGFGANAVFRRA